MAYPIKKNFAKIMENEAVSVKHVGSGVLADADSQLLDESKLCRGNLDLYLDLYVGGKSGPVCALPPKKR